VAAALDKHLYGWSNPRAAGTTIGGTKRFSDRVQTARAQHEDTLFKLLKQERDDLANAAEIAPYIVCGEETLHRFAKYRPSTVEKLGEIDGVGEERLAKYGQQLFDVIESFCARRGLHDRNLAPPEPKIIARALPKIGPTKQEAYRMFTEAGFSVDEVASAKAVKTDTVIGYLLDVYMNGWPLEFSRLPRLRPQDTKAVRAAVDSVQADGGDISSMKLIRERLVDQDFPYIDIRLQLARDGHLSPAELKPARSHTTGDHSNLVTDARRVVNTGFDAGGGAQQPNKRSWSQLDDAVGVREWSSVDGAAYSVTRDSLDARMDAARSELHLQLQERERRRIAGVGALAPRPVVLAACVDEVSTAAQVAGWYPGAPTASLSTESETAHDAAVGDANAKMARWYAQWTKKKRIHAKSGAWGRAIPQPWSLR
jgi:hypothetical protein